MKRDWDVIRDVLLEVEALTEEQRYGFSYGLVEGQSDAERSKAEHAYLLRDADYIQALDGGTLNSSAMLAPELTWAGHDLLATLRSKTVWERIKTTSKDTGIELTFDTVKTLGKAAVKWVAAQAGIDLG